MLKVNLLLDMDKVNPLKGSFFTNDFTTNPQAWNSADLFIVADNR
ncbi:hypothetical protein ACFLYB_07335 [Chloroflexota bacterium]